jgi:uncharacterized repeat protein (TIGR03803 family)
MPRHKTLILLSALLAGLSASLLTATQAFAASKERVLYSLCPESGCKDGDFPIGGVIFDSTGNLYGTAYEGGTHDAGTVYELSPGTNSKWTHKLLHTFNNTDGSGPEYSMIFDSAENLYGTTFFGGPGGGGVVFQLKPGTNGWTEKVLHGFADGNEGFYPVGALTLDAAGNLYGTTNAGGKSSGAVYQLTPTAKGSWKVRCCILSSAEMMERIPTAAWFSTPLETCTVRLISAAARAAAAKAAVPFSNFSLPPVTHGRRRCCTGSRESQEPHVHLGL